MAKQKTVTVELDKDLLDKLEKLSKETGMSISEVAEKILREHTENRKTNS